MVRPIKEGLDYFPLDVDIDQDDKIALIEATHGLEGFGVVIKILMKIYDNSYFYEWGEKEQLLFSRRVNVDINQVNEIINDCLKWGLFSEPLYEKHQILSSKGIQKRYLEASSRRKKVQIDNEYLLLNKKEVNSYKNLVIVNINSIDDNISTQRKVKESKGKESKAEETETDHSETTSDAIVFYQNNFGVVNPYVTQELLSWIDDLGDEMVIEALSRALDRNKPNWSYAKSILQSWVKKNITTLEQAKAEEVQFRNQQQKRYGSPKEDVQPDWFKKQLEDEQKQEPEKEQKKSQVELDAERIELSLSLNKDPMTIVPSLEKLYGVTAVDIQRVVDKEISALDLLNSRTSTSVPGG
ncbi:Lin1244/Lin1753 domain-containing protein [Salinibacillus xinjiangensis]|uniref:Lin1244/Lin1753 domain-containing protein n=1 Tax=Salinibacillus xinjiangensis TaxID=1229268 RepID=UPI0018914CAF|nr:Lin1244/Lin1753 domain-containing protein [Salinibacillus xinjiangensis]